MSFAILRTAKLKTMGEIGGSLAHTYRTRETPNADPERSQQNEHHGGETPEAVRKAISERIPEKHRSDAVLCVEYFVGASPEHFQNGQDGSAYFAAAVEWLKERHGAENVVATAIHRDETSPHLVAYVVPLDHQGKLNAKSFLGGKAVLSAMQTDFADKVGRAHGLERGLEGSKATHTTIREYYGRVSLQAIETPPVDVPAPSVAERVNPKAYGNRVAEAVVSQLAPELRQLRAKVAEALAKVKDMAATIRGKENQLKLARIELQASQTQLERLRPVIELEKAIPQGYRQLLSLAATSLEQQKQREKEAENAKPEPTPEPVRATVKADNEPEIKPDKEAER